MKVKNRKLVVIGNSAGFIIPSEERKTIDPEKKYDLEIEEAQEVESNGSAIH